jgi:hypothetical protein
LPSSTRNCHPGRLGVKPSASTTGRSLCALSCTSRLRIAGSVRRTLSYSAAIDTGRLCSFFAAACSEGRSPSDTSDVSPTTVENSSSRGYCRWRVCSNTSSIQPAGIACSSARRIITLSGACSSKRASTSFSIGSAPVGLAGCAAYSMLQQDLERAASEARMAVGVPQALGQMSQVLVKAFARSHRSWCSVKPCEVYYIY